MFMLQLSCYNFFIMKMFERRKSNNRETFAKHVTRQNQNTLGVLKNFAILELITTKVAGLLLQNTCRGFFWNFAVANTFFS